jgi:hypothetical protein
MSFLVEALTALNVNEYVIEDDEPTSAEEFNARFKLITGVDANGTAILSSDLSAMSVTWSDISAKTTELRNAQPLKNLREERNKKLEETDYWALSDTATMTTEQQNYRQALRDITNTYQSLDTVVWPEKP